MIRRRPDFAALAGLAERLPLQGYGLPIANLSGRPSSAPFVSGDTFRALAEVIVEGNEWFYNHSHIPELMFAEADEISGPNFPEACRNWVEKNRWNKPQLVIHNGDRTPTASALKLLSSTFDHIYAVNVVDSVGGVTAIPIGLENAHLRKNGVVKRFEKARKAAATNPRARLRNIGASFNTRTNSKVRDPALQSLLDAGIEFEQPSKRPSSYIKWVQSTKFIISPPGNGYDCHRTWEAIYLGAVPVVLEGSLHPNLVRAAPVLAVHSYGQFAATSAESLEAKFLEISNQDQGASQMAYWVRLLTARSSSRS